MQVAGRLTQQFMVCKECVREGLAVDLEKRVPRELIVEAICSTHLHGQEHPRNSVLPIGLMKALNRS